MKNARALLDSIRAGEKSFDFIEIMACPAAVCGGGQPIQPSHISSWIDLKKERAKALYSEDENLSIRKSHQNPVIQELYEKYFGEPGSEKAHELLHTHYMVRANYPEE